MKKEDKTLFEEQTSEKEKKSSHKAEKKRKKNEEKQKSETMEIAPKLYGNESFGIPSDCTKKQKFNSLKLFFYIVAVGVLCVLGYTGYRTATDYFLPEMSFDKTMQPILYTKNKGLMLKHRDKNAGCSVAEGTTLYGSANAKSYTGVTADGSGLFYAAENEENKQGFDLYFQKTNTIGDGKASPEAVKLVDYGVTAFQHHPEGKYVVYLKEDELYFSDLNSSVIIAAGVDDFHLSKNYQQVVYQKDGNKLFTCTADKNAKPLMVDHSITKVVSAPEEYEKIFYLKNNALWKKEYNSEPVRLATDVKDSIQLGEFVYFVQEESRPQRFYDVFLDDTSASDEKMEKPNEKNFVSVGENNKIVPDQEAYDAAMAEYEGKLFRDSIRAEYMNKPVMRTELVLYEYRENGIREIDCGLVTANLRYRGGKQTVVYQKLEEPASRVRMSDVTDSETAKTLVMEWLSAERDICMQVLIQDKHPYLGLEQWPQGQMEISLDGRFFYCIENIGENNCGTLVRYEISQRELRNRKELVDSITNFEVDGTATDVVIAFNGNKMGIYIGEKYTHLSDSSYRDFYYVDRTLYFYDGYNEETQTGVLMQFRDGNVKSIDIGVHQFDVRNMQTVSYIKDYNVAEDCGNLYLKEGNKQSEQIDFGVGSILN